MKGTTDLLNVLFVSVLFAQGNYPFSADLPFWQSTLSGKVRFQLHDSGSRLSIYSDGELRGLLDVDPKLKGHFSGLLHFPQTRDCAPDGLPVDFRYLDAVSAEIGIRLEAACPLKMSPGASGVTRFRLSRFEAEGKLLAPAVIKVLADQTWQSSRADHQGLKFRVKAYRDNLLLFSDHEFLGSLAARRDRRSGAILSYSGPVRLAPASLCPEGQGRMIITRLRAQLIEARIEEPRSDAKSGQLTCGSPTFGLSSILGPVLWLVPQPNSAGELE